jgi:hypothetical protein
MSMPTNFIAIILGLFVYTVFPEKAYPQDLETQAKALELVTKTANSICITVNTEGSSDSEEVTGAVNAKLNGLIGKLANLGISGAGSYGADRYAGLIRKDLPTALENVNACKTNVFNKLVPVLVPGSRRNPDRSDVSCPSIAGTWYSSDVNVLLPVRQDGCKISSEYEVQPFYYELAGHADGDKFEFTVKRTDPNGCAVIYYERFTAIEEQQMTSHTYRTSGQCGVPQSYTDTFIWVKR